MATLLPSEGSYITPAARASASSAGGILVRILRGVSYVTNNSALNICGAVGRPEAVAYLYGSLAALVFAERDAIHQQADYLLALVEGFGRVLFDLFGALAE